MKLKEIDKNDKSAKEIFDRIFKNNSAYIYIVNGEYEDIRNVEMIFSPEESFISGLCPVYFKAILNSSFTELTILMYNNGVSIKLRQWKNIDPNISFKDFALFIKEYCDKCLKENVKENE